MFRACVLHMFFPKPHLVRKGSVSKLQVLEVRHCKYLACPWNAIDNFGVCLHVSVWVGTHLKPPSGNVHELSRLGPLSGHQNEC